MGDDVKKSPSLDRLLMRLKDAIIIGTAAFALIKFFLLNPIQVQEQVGRQEQILIQQQRTLEKIADNLEVHTKQLVEIERRFSSFQRSFYSKKPGAWIYDDDQWKWTTINNDK